MRTGTGTNQIWDTRGETQDTERHSLTLLPPPERCVSHRTRGCSGGLKGHGDRTGQEASRAAPVLGAMAGQGTRAAMADRGARAAMAGQGTREAMADRGAWVAHGGSGELGRPWRNGELGRPWRVRGLGRPWRIEELGWPMVDPGTQEAMAERGAWEASMACSPPHPPKKNYWGNFISGGRSGGVVARGSGEPDGTSRGSLIWAREEGKHKTRRDTV